MADDHETGHERIERYVIKPHARFEALRRNITDDQVKTVLSSPGQVLSSISARKIFQKKFTIDGKEYLLRVFVDVQRNPPEVVTVYRTSKIGKNWR